MDNRPVLFLDSGIGGFPYFRRFRRNNPGERLVYVADREYFPYGPLDRPELVRRLEELLGRIVRRLDPKLVVLACNTATVSALAELRERFPALPFVGTVPAVKPAIRQSRKGHIGVLGTERTVGDPYITKLAAEAGPDCAVTAIAAPDLVEFVERRFAGSAVEERLAAVLPYIGQFRRAGADAVVLGCTHFIFLLEDFKAAAPDMSFHDSVEGVCCRAETLLEKGDLRAASPFAGGEDLLLITGSAAPEQAWQDWAISFALALKTEQEYGLC
jgi:glutamate racemase